MNGHRAALLILWLTASVAAGAGVADNSHAGATHEVTMDQAVKLVERQYRARVVKAETQKSGPHTTYVLKLLNDSGKVWTVHVDAASGAVH
jgi:uncharacterized membrane protein YkoI